MVLVQVRARGVDKYSTCANAMYNSSTLPYPYIVLHSELVVFFPWPTRKMTSLLDIALTLKGPDLTPVIKYAYSPRKWLHCLVYWLCRYCDMTVTITCGAWCFFVTEKWHPLKEVHNKNLLMDFRHRMSY